MELQMYEVLDLFKAAPTRQAKVEVLRANNSMVLRDVLYLTFHPSVQFFTTEYPKYYRPDRDAPPGMGWSHLGMEMRRMYLFFKDHPRSFHLSLQKREELLTQMLESFEPREAEVVIGMFKKNLPAVDLTKDIVQSAFPDLLTP